MDSVTGRPPGRDPDANSRRNFFRWKCDQALAEKTSISIVSKSSDEVYLHRLDRGGNDSYCADLNR